jgi:hypothetical protein
MREVRSMGCSSICVGAGRTARVVGGLAIAVVLISVNCWPQRVEIGQGVRLAVRLDETISTKNHYFGPIIQTTLDQDVLDSRGRVVLPAGSTIKLAMAEFKRAGRMVGRARLRLRLFSAVLPDGTEAPLDGYPTRLEGGPKPGSEGTLHGHRRFFKDAAIESSVILVGAGAGLAVGGPLGLPVGAAAGLLTAGIYFVARRGPDLVLPAGTVIEFTLDRPAAVNELATDPPPQNSYSYRPSSAYSNRDPAYSFPNNNPQSDVWGQGLAVPPSPDLVSLLDQVSDPHAVLNVLDHINFRNRSDSDRIFATYLRGLCDLELSKPKKSLDELERAYLGSKRLNLPRRAQSEIARNLVLALKASSRNWQASPLMNDPQLQAALVGPEEGE